MGAGELHYQPNQRVLLGSIPDELDIGITYLSAGYPSPDLPVTAGCGSYWLGGIESEGNLLA